MPAADKVGAKYARIMNRPWFRYFHNLRTDTLAGYLRDHPEAPLDTVIDLGCANNAYLGMFPSQSFKIGIDPSLKALRTSDDRDESHLIGGDACSLPVRDASTAFIFASGLLHHVHQKLGEVFKEAHRILVPGGVLYIDEPNGRNPLWQLVIRSPLGREIDEGTTKLLTIEDVVDAAPMFESERSLYYGLSHRPFMAVRWMLALRKSGSPVD